MKILFSFLFIILFLNFSISQSIDNMSDGYHDASFNERKITNSIYVGYVMSGDDIIEADNIIALCSKSVGVIKIDRFGHVYQNGKEVVKNSTKRCLIRKAIKSIEKDSIFVICGKHIRRYGDDMRLPVLPSSDISIQTPLTNLRIKNRRVYINGKKV